MIAELLPVFAGVALAQLTPGPNLLAVAAAALGSGRAAAVATAGGVAAGVFIWAILFAFGMGAILSAAPAALTAMKLIGGAYLVWLGWCSLRKLAHAPAVQADAAPAFRLSLRGAAAKGLLVVLTNPKAALMWVGVSLYTAGMGMSHAEFLALGLGVATSAMAIYGGYAIAFSTAGAARLHQRFGRLFEAAFGAVFAALGLRLIYDGARALR